MLPFIHRRYAARLQVPQQLHVEYHHRPFAPLLRFFPPLQHQLRAETDRTFSLRRRMDLGAAAASSYSRTPFTSSSSSSQSFFRRIRMNAAAQSSTATTSHFPFISNARRWCSSSSSSSSPPIDDTSTTAAESQEKIGEQATAPKTTDTSTQKRKFGLLELAAFDDNKTVRSVVSPELFYELEESLRSQLDRVTVKDVVDKNAPNLDQYSRDLAKIMNDEQFKQYRQKLEAHQQLVAIEALITVKSTSKLLSGQSARHVDALAYGMRGRERPLGELVRSLSEIRSPVSTKEAPFIVVISMPRQGKTRFLDEIGHSPESIATLAGNNTFDPTSVFIFNVTFNSNWRLPDDKKYSLQEAQNEVSLRLIAAAMGVFTGREMEQSPPGTESLITAFLSLCNPSVSGVACWLQYVVWKLHHGDKDQQESNATFFFLFDELTELGDRVKHGAEAEQTQESQMLEFYSSLADIIGTRCAVIGSGFTQIVLDRKLTASKRPVRPCTLFPVVKNVQRRQLLVMKTFYFQLTSIFAPSEAVLFYELTKSSPGVLGAILELLSSVYLFFLDCSETLVQFLGADNGIPYLQSVGNRHKAMKNVMAWKSIQFCSALSDSEQDPLLKLAPTMRSDCEEAEKQKAASTDAASIIWLGEPISPVTQQGTNRKAGYLSNVLVEPLFYLWSGLGKVDKTALSASSTDFFKLFAHVLKEYSKCCSMIGKDEKSSDHVNNCVLHHFVPSTQARNRPPKFSSTKDKIDVRTLSTLNGCFFEDAVAVGICAQKQLRLSLKERNEISSNKTVSGITSSLTDFFVQSSRQAEGTESALSECLSPLIETRTLQDPGHVIEVEWISADKQQIPVSLVHFYGDYPGRRETQGEYDEAIVWADNEKRVGTTNSIADCFNTHTVLRPARPESNPLVDIIFHEKVTNSNNNELIQFWVDTKHSHESVDPFKNRIDKFEKRVQAALNNPILTSKSSKIKHIVHIIVSTFKPNAFAKKDFASFQNSLNDGRLGNSLPFSYTLYIVDPDSLAFEHLVSHVIARSMPLMEQQHVESWSRSLGFADEWRTFKAVSTDGTQLDASGSTNELFRQFAKWEQLRLDDDFVSLVEAATLVTTSSTADARKKSVVISNLPPANDLEFEVNDRDLKQQLRSFLAMHQGSITITIETNVNFSRYAVVSGFRSAGSAISCAKRCNGRWIALHDSNFKQTVAFLLQVTQQRRPAILQDGPTIRFQFGAALEAFGIVNPSRGKNGYNRNSRVSGPLLQLTEVQGGSRLLNLMLLTTTVSVNVDGQYDLLTMLYRSVRIGHLLQHDKTSQHFFLSVFQRLNESATKNARFQKRLINFARNGVTNGEQLQIDKERACTLFICSLWNLSVADWERWRCLSKASGCKMSHRRFLSNEMLKQIDERTSKLRDFLFSGEGITVF